MIFTRPQITSQTKPRFQFIDLAKGFCILLVVIDHCGINTGIWTNHLRMPLYFILSGLFFKNYGSKQFFICKKTNNILIPFIAFYLVGLLYAFLIAVLCQNSLDVFKIGIPAFFYGEKIDNYALWFLLTLFWTNLIFLCIYSITDKEWVRTIIILLIALCSDFINSETGWSYMYIGSALMNLPFFYLGYLLKKTSILYENNNRNIELIWGGILLIISILLVDVFQLDYIRFANAVMVGSRIIQYLTCSLCVCGFLLVCKTIYWLPIVSYLGRFSIIVLVTHPIVIGISEIIFRHLCPDFSPVLKSAAMLIVTILICIVLIPLLRRFCPKITAQKEFIRINK